MHAAAPAAAKLPLHGTGAALPRGQEDPAGQMFCWVLAVVASGQKKPARHGFAVLEVLPVARHLPAGHAEHCVAPGLLKKPEPQGVAELEPAAQKEPAGHDCALSPRGQKKPAVHGFAVVDVLPAVAQNPRVHTPVHVLVWRPVPAP